MKNIINETKIAQRAAAAGICISARARTALIDLLREKGVKLSEAVMQNHEAAVVEAQRLFAIPYEKLMESDFSPQTVDRISLQALVAAMENNRKALESMERCVLSAVASELN